MFMNPPGEALPDSATLRARQDHDAAAYAVARLTAKREMTALMMALLEPALPASEVEPRARMALHAVSVLWETAARLTEN